MLYSSSLYNATKRFGIERGTEMYIDAGFPALDLGFFGDFSYVDAPDYKERFEELRKYAESKGAVFDQAHAPFGGGYENYTKVLLPKLPRVLEVSAILGIKNVVVHPLQNGRYYSREEELFELNMKFYRRLAPLAKEYGLKIAIENMWQRHMQAGYIIDDVCAPPCELVKYYDTLDDPEAFTVCLDIGHVALCGREPEDAIRIIGRDRLGALHVHDVDYKEDLHTVPGLGRLNWENICRALGEINYSGTFTLEATGYGSNLANELIPSALRLMNDAAKFYSDKVDLYRIF